MVWLVLAVAALPFVQPSLRLNYSAHPTGYLFPFTGLVALTAALYMRRRERDIEAFCASGVFILTMLSSVAWGVYPNILIATGDPAYSLTVDQLRRRAPMGYRLVRPGFSLGSAW